MKTLTKGSSSSLRVAITEKKQCLRGRQGCSPSCQSIPFINYCIVFNFKLSLGNEQWIERYQTKSYLRISLAVPGYPEFVTPVQTHNAEYCCNTLKSLKENVRSKWSELWHNGNKVFQHDNKSGQTAQETCKFLILSKKLTLPTPTGRVWLPATSFCSSEWSFVSRSEPVSGLLSNGKCTRTSGHKNCIEK